MPSKTRKQKILSDHHKKTSPFIFSYSATNIKQTKKQTNSVLDFNQIRKDIYKTVILAVIFIIFEILLAIYSKKLGW